jgi:1,5-anhydro-D-fructose reductase (1,5-anhydro-D-mannitol-forming)
MASRVLLGAGLYTPRAEQCGRQSGAERRAPDTREELLVSEKIGIAKLSFAHVHAAGYAEQIKNNPDAELVAIWDEDPARGKIEAEKRGMPFYAELDAVLALNRVQGVVVDAPTNLHPMVIIAAANAGKHVFTEKALTITIKEANEVVAAVKKAGVKFMISLPSRVRPEILFAKKAIDDGLLGSVTEMRARIAHMAALDKWFNPGDGHSGSMWFGDEKAAGGGAFFDLGCHRVDVMRWFLGEPGSVVARMNNFSGAYPIDDNMVAVVEFKNRALGILDVSWVHRAGPNPLEVYGTHGFLSIDMGPGPRVWLESVKLEANGIKGGIAPSNLPPAPPMPMVQWINAIKDGSPMTIDIQDGWNLTQLMEGCYTAARTGQAYTF